MADDEVDFSKLPLDQRLSHKVWKARVSGYEDLARIFKQLDPDAENEYRKHADTVKKIIQDANQVALEAGLGAVAAYIEFGPATVSAKTRPAVLPSLLDKCIAAPRTSMRQKALEIVLFYVEVDEGAAVVEELLKGLDNKSPKVQAACVMGITESVRAFGVKVLDTKPVLKSLGRMFGSADKGVRAEATNLTVELYRWLGKAIESFLEPLKPVQRKELEDLFSALPPGRAQPTRLPRSQQGARAAAAASVEDTADDAVEAEREEEEVDPMSLMDPVNVLDKIDDATMEALNSQKWKERKEAVEKILEILKPPKLQEGRYGELVGILGKKIGDANLFVAIGAANCIQRLAEGLRGSFASYKSLVVSHLIDRTKEKKQNLLDALRGALDAVYATVTLSAVLEDIVAGAGNKNPQVKAESLRWLVRCLKTMKKAPEKAEIKMMCEMSIKGADDAVIEVRDGSFEVMGTLLRVVGERLMGVYLEKLDDIKKAKVMEFFEKAEVKLKTGGPVKKAPATTGGSGTLKKTPYGSNEDIKNKENAPPGSSTSSLGPRAVKPGTVRPPQGSQLTARASLFDSNQKVPKTSSAAAATAPAKGKAKESPKEEETLTAKWSEEAAEAAFTEACGEELVGQLADGQWKNRLAALETVLQNLSSKPLEPEVIVRTLSRKPGFKESNFQCVAKMVNIMQALAKAPGFTRATVVAAMPFLADKFGDMKNKKTAGDCLSDFCESTSFQFVLAQVCEFLKTAKSPKALQDGLSWIQANMLDFGIAGLKTKDLVEFIKIALGNTTQAVRTGAVSLLGTLRMYVGPDLRSLVQDVNPALLGSIDAEFAKYEGRTPPQATRMQGVNKPEGVSDESSTPLGSSSSKIAESVDPLEDLIPRVDISSQISDKLLADLGDGNWKTRKEGLDEVTKIIESANKRIKPNIGELLTSLKGRMNDNNKNLVAQSLDIVGLIAQAMGKPFERNVRLIFSNVASCLGDNKQNVRQSALAAIDRMLETSSMDTLVSCCEEVLRESKQPILRKELLGWLSQKLTDENVAKPSGGLAGLLSPIIQALQDANADVRKAAQVCLGPIVSSGCYDEAREKVSELKGPAAQGILTLLENFKPAAKPGIGRSVGVSKTGAAPGGQPQANVAPPFASKAGTLKKKPSMASLPGSASTSSSNLRKDEPLEKPPPILTSDARAKEARADKDRGLFKWMFDVPRKELIELLNSQMEANFSAEVTAFCFSEDHNKDRDHLKAVSILDDCIASPSYSFDEYGVSWDDIRKRYVANTDIMLKYVTLRFFDTNTIILLKLLDFLEHLFDVLDGMSYNLTEYEAASFVPFLVNKLGDPKEAIRARLRGILKQLCRVCPASKLFNYLLDGLKSKNSRTRIESLEEIGSLLQRNGMGVCIPSKVLPIIGAQISDRDSQVRSAAINVICQAYQLDGDKVFKSIGKISDKDKSLVEERLRRLPAPQPSASSTSRPITAPPKTTTSEHPDTGAILEHSLRSTQSGEVRHFALDFDPVPTTSTNGVARPTMDGVGGRSESPRAPTNRNGDLGANDTLRFQGDWYIAQIGSGVPDKSLNALKKLEEIVQTSPEVILPSISQIVNAITLQMRLAFNDQDTKLCRYVISSLLHMTQRPELARAVAMDSLEALFREVLSRIVEQTALHSEQGKPLVKALNMVMVRILDNGDINESFRVLLSYLDSSSQVLFALVQARDESRIPSQHKLVELIMKCLWKLTKQLRAMVESNSIQVNKLLYDINTFFISTPPSEWKNRANNKFPHGDMPLRTVKTILSELARALGESIHQQFDLIEEPSRSYVYSYVTHMVSRNAQHSKSGALPNDSPDASARNHAGRRTSGDSSPPMSHNPLPKASVSSGDVGVDAYKEKLSKFKRIMDDTPSGTPPTNGIPAVEDKSLRHGASIETLPPLEVSVNTSALAPAEIPAVRLVEQPIPSSNTSLADLRARLQRVKSQISQ
ncbi:ARM repeat-containing protein [Gonapodya prolifera JEL478]|uniref:ARM repeat-containing protein n=1 Tax=Gonapodya prolifera (strain JEL478) TaxID=1344416 RepID=A0A139AQC5_GONPJ|nr:ARM repeat-containing protein [Gonapodya prolifera JEL478]|eukprot:KXS18928.1 ARM repeat-containing protein [Gonapodya prolifera JEL478]